MTNKITSDIIAEGIDRSIFGQTFKALIYVILFIEIIVLLVIGLGLITQHFNPIDYSNIGTSESSCFPLTNLECEITENMPTIDGVIETRIHIAFANVCGYEEANEYYENVKLSQPLTSTKSKLVMECK
jgi:hypothetical protein